MNEFKRNFFEAKNGCPIPDGELEMMMLISISCLRSRKVTRKTQFTTQENQFINLFFAVHQREHEKDKLLQIDKKQNTACKNSLSQLTTKCITYDLFQLALLLNE